MHPNILLQLARTELHDRLQAAEGRRLAALARHHATVGRAEVVREGPTRTLASRRPFVARRARGASPDRVGQRLRALPPLKSSRQLCSESSTSNFLAAACMRFHARSRSASVTPST